MRFPEGMGYTPGELAAAIESEWATAGEPRPYDGPTLRVESQLLDILDLMRPLVFETPIRLHSEWT